MKMTLSTTKKGALDDLTRRESLNFSGFASGVKAQRRAFTLIELLVVIAIIAILAAILLPVLDRAKQTGLKVSDINNFKQLQTCYRMYVDDNNDYLPLNNLGSGSGVTSWLAYVTPNASAQYDFNTVNIRKATIYPYNQNVKIYVCPANNYNLVIGDGSPPPGPYRDDSGRIITAATVPETRTCSIEYSMGAGGGNTPAWTESGNGATWKTYQKFSSIQTYRVSQKIVFCDEASGSIDDGAWAMWPMNVGENYWWNVPGSRHLGGCVFSFADGHVEYHKWLGGLIPSIPMQTSGPGNGGAGFPAAPYWGELGPGGTVVGPVTGSDLADLAWAQAGCPQYP